ncbi:hypothetical protein [Armatimonas sp.]|uniref:hypothetical protein n=1 Tax=Armatimonas sp. TaxID=1872638 RepID=UPI00374CF4FF
MLGFHAVGLAASFLQPSHERTQRPLAQGRRRGKLEAYQLTEPTMPKRTVATQDEKLVAEIRLLAAAGVSTRKALEAINAQRAKLGLKAISHTTVWRILHTVTQVVP